MVRSLPKPFSYLPPPLNREENLLFQLEVVERIVCRLILIVILIYALRKLVRNSSSGGQMPVNVNASGDDSDTNSDQIAMTPTFLALDMTRTLYNG
ncbi:hypothetical protein FCV25MIE_00248 [Fagus crenata]